MEAQNVPEESKGRNRTPKDKKKRKRQVQEEEDVENKENVQEQDGEGDNTERSEKKYRKSKQREVYIYGNYPNYYGKGYRGAKDKKDPRLFELDKIKNLIYNRKCLDIGCNSGIMTFDIAHRFKVESILGIDIDSSLIERANNLLAKKKEFSQQKQIDFPISFQIGLGPLKKRFPDTVSFMAGNILEFQSQEQFDVIFCLSVSKWIHLNWGDEGIKNLFKKVNDLLAPGGIFVFEPQLWSSYTKKSKITPQIKQTYASIQFKPDQFEEYLVKEYNLKVIATLHIQDEDTAANFQRPILVLRKKPAQQQKTMNKKKKNSKKSTNTDMEIDNPDKKETEKEEEGEEGGGEADMEQ